MKIARMCGHMMVGIAVLTLCACQGTMKTDGGSSVPAPTVPTSLKHRYSFTGSAKDLVGNIDGVLKGAAKVADGKLVLDGGYKGSSDPTLSYLEFSGSLLPKGDSVSIAIWFSTQNVEGFSRLLDIGEQDVDQGRAFIYFTPRTSGGMARAAISATDTSGRIYVDVDPLDDGMPHMAVIVIEGAARKLRLFVDGKEPVAGADLGENTLDTVRPVHNWVGRSLFDQDTGITASIDEIRVYDKALSVEEIAAAYAAGPDALPAAR